MNLKDWRAMSPKAQQESWNSFTPDQRQELFDQGLSQAPMSQFPISRPATLESLHKETTFWKTRPEKRDLESLLMSIRRASRIKGLDAEPDIHGMLENSDYIGLRKLNLDLWGRVYTRTKKSNCVVEKLHDDGDASIRCGDKKFVVTTEGEIYEKVPPKPVARINKSGDVEMVKNEMAEQLYLDIFGEEKK